MNISDNVPVLPPKASRLELPYVATRLFLGAKIHKNFKGHKDVVAVESEGRFSSLSLQDFDLVNRILDRVKKEVDVGKMVSVEKVLWIHRLAVGALESMTRDVKGRGIVMLKDMAGSGYWRMVLPAKHMDKTGLFVDVSAAVVNFDYLLEYDTVFVQRVHDWDSFYTLEKLKNAGKRIVYDIDDEIFSIPWDNPASRIIGKDEQTAALACMKLADCLTTTTPILQDRLIQLVGGHPVIVPNALDPDDGWLPTEKTGSPDEWKRIFWQGSSTHAADWMECIEAVDIVMKKRDDVRVVILGFLPPVVQEKLKEPHWKGRVEFSGFNAPETYFEIVKRVRAEVGIAPLQTSYFNAGKSEIKWLEYSLVGIPTVASYAHPYMDVIGEGEGIVCATTDEWVGAIEICLDDKKRRIEMVMAARKKAREQYNIKETSKVWRSILAP